MRVSLRTVGLCVLFWAAASQLCGQESRLSPEQIEQRLAEFLKRNPASDANGDGKLTREELQAFQQQQRGGRDMEARLKEALERFPQADTNKDGELTLEEFRSFQAKRREAQEAAREKAKAPVADFAYGEHPKQRFDLWPVPDAKEPTPLVIYIHGGGFRGGDKAPVNPNIPAKYHEQGVAFASMNYRLSDVGPYPIMMQDAARGLQTIRHNAKKWNIDPERVVCYGGSAGAGISLWLAFHDDLADPDSDDPIARQSTRILAAGTQNGQSTYDMHTFREWFDVPDLKMHEALFAFYDIESDADLEKDDVKKLMQDASPITHLSKDDKVSVYMTYGRPNDKVTKESSPGFWVHHALLGLKLQEAMKKFDLECIVTAPKLEAEDPYGSLERFLIKKVKGEE